MWTSGDGDDLVCSFSFYLLLVWSSESEKQSLDNRRCEMTDVQHPYEVKTLCVLRTSIRMEV